MFAVVLYSGDLLIEEKENVAKAKAFLQPKNVFCLVQVDNFGFVKRELRLNSKFSALVPVRRSFPKLYFYTELLKGVDLFETATYEQENGSESIP